MMRPRRLRPTGLLNMALALMAAAVPLGARADDRPACERFDWPLTTETAWFADRALPLVATGTELDAVPVRGLTLELKPAGEVRLNPPPSRSPRAESPMSGIVTFPVTQAGLYQVTISADGWVDAVQTGATVAAASHTGNRECVGLRKSVRFNLKEGFASIQISSAYSLAIRIAIRRLDRGME